MTEMEMQSATYFDVCTKLKSPGQAVFQHATQQVCPTGVLTMTCFGPELLLTWQMDSN